MGTCCSKTGPGAHQPMPLSPSAVAVEVVDVTTTPQFTKLTNLASERIGAEILFATDEWFSAADDLLVTDEPLFDPTTFTEYGKEMSGWESRRRRMPGHDWCIIKLGVQGVVVGVDIDTCHFTGNYSPAASIQGACIRAGDEDLVAAEAALLRHRAERLASRHNPSDGMMGTAATSEGFELAAALQSDKWETLVPTTPLGPGREGTRHTFVVTHDTRRWTHLRLNQFPDGGIARLRVHGIVFRDFASMLPTTIIDAASSVNGAVAVSCSDAHYGHPKNLLNPGRGVNMGDGWETARNLLRPAVMVADEHGHLDLPYNDWAIIRLATPTVVSRVEVDTAHFKGNFPETVSVEGAYLDPAGDNSSLETGDLPPGAEWFPVLERVPVGPDHQFVFPLDAAADAPRRPVSHVRLSIYPDGGVSRLRVFGTVFRQEGDASGEWFFDPFRAGPRPPPTPRE